MSMTCLETIQAYGLRSIGQVANPLPEMTTAIRDTGGYAEGKVERVGLFGDTAEISVK